MLRFSWKSLYLKQFFLHPNLRTFHNSSLGSLECLNFTLRNFVPELPWTLSESLTLKTSSQMYNLVCTGLLQVQISPSFPRLVESKLELVDGCEFLCLSEHPGDRHTHSSLKTATKLGISVVILNRITVLSQRFSNISLRNYNAANLE